MNTLSRTKWIKMIAEEYGINYDRAAYAVDILISVPSRKYSIENLLGIEEPVVKGSEWRHLVEGTE